MKDLPKLATLKSVNNGSSATATFCQPHHITLQGSFPPSLSPVDMPSLSNVYLNNRFAYKDDLHKDSLLLSPPFISRHWSPLKLYFPFFLYTLSEINSSVYHTFICILMDVSHAKNDRYVRIEALRRQYKTCFKKLLLNLKVLTSILF